eukprot:42939-Hanusia_phi.AAC.1
MDCPASELKAILSLNRPTLVISSIAGDRSLGPCLPSLLSLLARVEIIDEAPVSVRAEQGGERASSLSIDYQGFHQFAADVSISFPLDKFDLLPVRGDLLRAQTQEVVQGFLLLSLSPPFTSSASSYLRLAFLFSLSPPYHHLTRRLLSFTCSQVSTKGWTRVPLAIDCSDLLRIPMNAKPVM